MRKTDRLLIATVLSKPVYKRIAALSDEDKSAIVQAVLERLQEAEGGDPNAQQDPNNATQVPGQEGAPDQQNAVDPNAQEEVDENGQPIDDGQGGDPNADASQANMTQDEGTPTPPNVGQEGAVDDQSQGQGDGGLGEMTQQVGQDIQTIQQEGGQNPDSTMQLLGDMMRMIMLLLQAQVPQGMTSRSASEKNSSVSAIATKVANDYCQACKVLASRDSDMEDGKIVIDRKESKGIKPPRRTPFSSRRQRSEVKDPDLKKC